MPGGMLQFSGSPCKVVRETPVSWGLWRGHPKVLFQEQQDFNFRFRVGDPVLSAEKPDSGRRSW